MKYTEEDLEFHPIREMSPQWNVKAHGAVIARVTERYIAEPPFVVTRIKEDADAGETLCKDRDEVVQVILSWNEEEGRDGKRVSGSRASGRSSASRSRRARVTTRGLPVRGPEVVPGRSRGQSSARTPGIPASRCSSWTGFRAPTATTALGSSTSTASTAGIPGSRTLR